MERCSLCNGRLLKTEFGTRCMNAQCENSKLERRDGNLCVSCHEIMEFRRNNAYGDRVYWCEGCQKEATV